MPMNGYGEIIRNSSPPPSILPNNNNGNDNRGKEVGIAIVIAIAILIAVIWFIINAIGNKNNSNLVPEPFTNDTKVTESSEVSEDNTISTKLTESSEKEYSNNNEHSFYDIWTFASKELTVAQDFASDFEENGWDCYVFLTSEWDNLNQDGWYTVSVGVYSSKQDAQKCLSDIQREYSDAYIKYSGDYKGY